MGQINFARILRYSGFRTPIAVIRIRLVVPTESILLWSYNGWRYQNRSTTPI